MTQQPAAALRAGWQFALQPGRWLLPLLLAVVLLTASLFVGFLLAVANFAAAALITGILGLALALVVPLRWLLVMMLLLVYLVVGQLQYFLGIDKAFWLPYLLGLLIYMRLLGLRLSQPPRSLPRAPALGAQWLIALFLTTAVVSSLVNQVPPLQWFVAGKEYFFLWGVMLCVLAGVVTLQQLDRWSKLVVVLLFLQIPAVVYQRFVVVPNRGGASAFDAVVGLFGGDPMGGGASGAMAVFSMITLAFVLEGWRSQRLRGRHVLPIVILATIPVLLAEVKVVLFLLPFVLLLVYGRGLFKRPLASLMVFLGGFCFLVGLLALYQAQFTEDPAKRQLSLVEFAELIIERNTQDRLVSSFGEMGRIPALRYWWRQELEQLSPNALIGHGVGATRVGALAVGDLVRKHRLRLGRSTLAVYLWEVGVIGTAAIVAGIAGTALLGFRTARRADPERAWRLRACAIGLLLLLITFPYNTDFVEVSQIQVLFMLLAGYVIAAYRRSPAA